MKKLSLGLVSAALLSCTGFGLADCITNNDENAIKVTYVVRDQNYKDGPTQTIDSIPSSRFSCVPFTPNTQGVDNPFYFRITSVTGSDGKTYTPKELSPGALIDGGTATVTPIQGGGYSIMYGESQTK